MSNQGKNTRYYTQRVLCSFCGHRPEKEEKFVEGPAVYICARCVTLCEKVLSKTKDIPEQKYVPTDPTKKREIILCSFCGKDREEVRALFSGPGVYICNGCVDLCVAALSKQPKDTPVPKHVPIPLHRVFCAFCGHHPEKGRNMIAGPGVYICEPCVAFGAEAISLELKRNPEPKKAAETKQPPVYPRGNSLCSFCGRRPDEARRLIPGPAVSICDKCVAVSVKIISGEWEIAPGSKFKTFAHLYRPKSWRRTPI